MIKYKKFNIVNRINKKTNYTLITYLLLLNQSFTYAINQKFADIHFNLKMEDKYSLSSHK